VVPEGASAAFCNEYVFAFFFVRVRVYPRLASTLSVS
jgi:hypothetical protein